MATHLVAFYTATAGVNGPTLGSDEEDIVLIQYLVLDVCNSKILTEQQYFVRPLSSDVNENFLGVQCREDYALTEDQVKNGQTLEGVLDSFETILNKLEEDGSTVNLLTDGQLHLRQVLHPKAVAQGMDLPLFYHRFFDLRKEFRSFYHLNAEVASMKEMLDYSDLISDNSSNLAVKSTRDMCRIVKKMFNEGHRFAIPEVISIRLEPGICTRSEEVDSGCVVRARGLPWQSSDQDIAKFFRGLNIAKGGVALCLSPQGRRNGEALVRFVSAEHRDMALKRHKHHIGNRYIEVYKATGDDFINVAGGNNNEAQQFLSRGGQVIIRMRGLPYDCNAKQVVEFFEAGENGCEILGGEDGVLFVRKPDGRATGDAFVLFGVEEESSKALSKHREIIGSRYIELFRSTTAEVQQVLNRSMDPRTYEQQQPLMGQIPQMPMLPQQFITASNRKDCIRLRGLPYEAQVEHVLEFLGESAKNIVFRGVHMVINAQGQPSGEAFIQMDNEQSAFMAAQNRHHRYMIFGKKQRYIEVFHCSGEDMNIVLSGGIPAQRAVVSPGMLMWDQNTGASSPIPQGAPAPPGLFPPGSPRPQIPGSVLSPYAQAFSTAPNGALLQSLMAAQVKPEQVLLSNQMIPAHLRPHMLQQHHLDPASQAPTGLVQSLKSPVTHTNFIHPAMLGQYGEMSLAGQGIPPGMFIFQSPKMPSVSMTPGMPQQLTFVSVASAPDVRKTQNYQPKYTFPAASLLPVSYAASSPITMTGMRFPQVSSNGKRSFEQAFTADKSNSLRPMKRPPPRIPNPTLNQSPVGASRNVNPHLTPPHLQSSPFAGLTTQHTMNGASIPTPMIPTLYPPPPLYPPAI